MSGFEIAGLILGIAGLVPLLKEGYDMVKEYRQRKKSRLLESDSSTSELKDTLEDSSTALASRYKTLQSAYGKKFSNGDSIAHAQLSKIVIILQAEIITTLRAALMSGNLENPYHLTNVASQGRQDAIQALTQFAQRISTTIAPMLSNMHLNNTPRYSNTSRIQEIEDTDDNTRYQRLEQGIASSKRPVSLVGFGEFKEEKQRYPYINKYTQNLLQNAQKYSHNSPPPRSTQNASYPYNQNTMANNNPGSSTGNVQSYYNAIMNNFQKK
ncbi:hypothetical protein TWF718_004409 [Orbilia javanica]|uniref:Uncharacterized protein n=1 Tax=Orbilia javanica TaxID=47235 RepID=A0AAN8MXS1_9PEZI